MSPSSRICQGLCEALFGEQQQMDPSLENNGSDSSSTTNLVEYVLPQIPQEEIIKAKEECAAIHSNLSSPIWDQGTYCPRVFDGWSCWNDTPAGDTASVKCPSFVPGFDSKLFGHKFCTENGTWFQHPDTNQAWSNYSTCVDLSGLGTHLSFNRIYIIGYSISIAALAISLFIFFYFRSLNCKRVTIHKNLFVSFLSNNLLYLIWYMFVIEDVDVFALNGWGCITLHVLIHYFLVANYLWMFCEGLYLHTLLVLTFISESKIIKWFYLLGWGFPLVLIIIYAVARGLDDEANALCWIHETDVYEYILSVPVLISLIINVGFLINIVRVLLTKLRGVNVTPDNQATKKAVRATLILIPLLGLYYMIIPFRPPVGSAAYEVYMVFSAIVSSYQGFAVSLLFCFFNGEVLAIFKKKWNQHRLMRAPQSYANTSVSYMKASVNEGVTFTTNYSDNNLSKADQV